MMMMMKKMMMTMMMMTMMMIRMAAHLMKTPCRNSRGPQRATAQCNTVKDSDVVKFSNEAVQGSVEKSKIHCDEGQCSEV